MRHPASGRKLPAVARAARHPGVRGRAAAIGKMPWLAAAGLGRAVWRWRQRARQRQALATLDERLLRDIGVKRREARRELDKWMWQA